MAAESSNDEPTVEELVAKALEAKVIDEDFASELSKASGLGEALGMFYSYVIENSDVDPNELLRRWDIAID